MDIFALIQAGDAAAVASALAANPELVHAHNREGISATLYAAHYRRPEVWQLFAVLNERPSIFEAAALGLFNSAEQWLIQDPGLVGAESPDGFSPLGLACFMGQIAVVRLCIAYGAEVDRAANNATRVAPLHSAVAAGNYEITDFLLQHDACPNCQQAGGHTPLHSAAHQGRRDLVALLLQYDADPTLTNDQGQTPADLAVEKGFTEVAALLAG